MRPLRKSIQPPTTHRSTELARIAVFKPAIMIHMPITTTAAIIGNQFHRPPVGAETPDKSRGDCCSLGVGRGGVAAVACVRRTALWAAATEEAATAASPQGASILPPQLKQFAEASGFFVPQRVQYISIPKGSENTKLLIYDGPANHISVHKRSTAETDVH
jgi:hypothetical protein